MKNTVFSADGKKGQIYLIYLKVCGIPSAIETHSDCVAEMLVLTLCIALKFLTAKNVTGIFKNAERKFLHLCSCI